MARDIVIAGWGQITQRKEQTRDLLDPLGLMERAARDAVEGAGLPLRDLHAILVVRPMSAHYPVAAAQLAERLGAHPRLAEVSRIGGNSPQTLVNRAAWMIARRELETVLVVAAEAYYRRNRSHPVPETALFQGVPAGYDADDMVGTT